MYVHSIRHVVMTEGSPSNGGKLSAWFAGVAAGEVGQRAAEFAIGDHPRGPGEFRRPESCDVRVRSKGENRHTGRHRLRHCLPVNRVIEVDNAKYGFLITVVEMPRECGNVWRDRNRVPKLTQGRADPHPEKEIRAEDGDQPGWVVHGGSRELFGHVNNLCAAKSAHQRTALI